MNVIRTFRSLVSSMGAGAQAPRTLPLDLYKPGHFLLDFLGCSASLFSKILPIASVDNPTGRIDQHTAFAIQAIITNPPQIPSLGADARHRQQICGWSFV